MLYSFGMVPVIDCCEEMVSCLRFVSVLYSGGRLHFGKEGERGGGGGGEGVIHIALADLTMAYCKQSVRSCVTHLPVKKLSPSFMRRLQKDNHRMAAGGFSTARGQFRSSQ